MSAVIILVSPTALVFMNSFACWGGAWGLWRAGEHGGDGCSTLGRALPWTQHYVAPVLRVAATSLEVLIIL